jgi:hypothetical protein
LPLLTLGRVCRDALHLAQDVENAFTALTVSAQHVLVVQHAKDLGAALERSDLLEELL